MAVPFIDLRRFEPDFLPKWNEICARISAETQFIAGPEATRLEERLTRHLGAGEVVACANGTDALQLALRAVGVGPGDLVVIPDATFWATFEAPVNVGARVITVDVDPNDLQMDFELFRRAVDQYRPKAAILVHLYGWCSARLAEFRDFCRERDVALIEDGAQAFDVTVAGRQILGDALIATLSFYPAKVLGACGDAGAVVCSSAELATTVRRLGNHGRTSHYGYGLIGWNSRISGFDAAYLNLSLDYLGTRLESRRHAAALYQSELSKIGFEVVRPPAGVRENGYLNVTLHDPEARPALEAKLKASNIGFGNVYPGTMSSQPASADHLEAKIGGDVADRLCRGVLNLPLFAGIREDEIAEVLAALR
jgi:UDP-2-acetamido-2-deoxy-ribo-hexuluronate aminotransferase